MSKPATILLVEDNPDVQFIIQLLLGETYQLAFAPNGKEGLEKATADPPDLIITDTWMPVMGGREFIRQARSHESLTKVPIIIVTGNAGPEDCSEMVRAGLAQDLLLKPFAMSELKAIVEKWLNR